MSPKPGGFTLACNAFHTPARGRLEILADVIIEVDDDGQITRVVRPDESDHAERLAAARLACRLRQLRPGQFLLPGLVDLHIHAPQWPQLGKALDAPLQDWLQRYTFPLEARFSDIGFAREVYRSLVDALLGNGTTTAVYFATLHVEATVALAEICLERGQRAVVGKVAMDNADQCPDFYRDADVEAAVLGARAVIERIETLQEGQPRLIHGCVTPRFIPSCTDALLRALGDLARETGAYVQTHCSESDWEVDYTHRRFGVSDAEVLSQAGLLTNRAILAHANHVSATDCDRIEEAGAAIAHCPLSNIYFADAVFPLRAALDRGLKLGLGTDVAGGHSPSVLENARFAVAASRVLDSGVEAARPRAERGVSRSSINIIEAFWLATAGGGEALGLPIGVFLPGFAFDAIIIDTDAPDTDLQVWSGCDTPAEAFEKIVLGAQRSDISTVWVQGRQVRSDHVGRGFG